MHYPSLIQKNASSALQLPQKLLYRRTNEWNIIEERQKKNDDSKIRQLLTDNVYSAQVYESCNDMMTSEMKSSYGYGAGQYAGQRVYLKTNTEARYIKTHYYYFFL